MKTLLGYFKRWFNQDFQWGPHVATLLLLIPLITLNYSIDLERSYLNTHVGEWQGWLYFFSFYGGIYYAVTLLQSLWSPGKVWRQPMFWVKSAAFLAILALNAAADFHYSWLYGLEAISPQVRTWLFYVVVNAGSFFNFALPLYLTWWLWDRNRQEGWYGLQRKKFLVGPYLLLLAAMLPFIIWASFQPDFQATYPIYVSNAATGEATGLGQWGNTLLFQLAYGLDFLTVELLFRGALIIGMTRLMGKEALLPMVAVYCALHFGKPVGEAISSIFGGYILGVIALYGRHIWGGVIIHVGIALSMEWAAIWQALR